MHPWQRCIYVLYIDILYHMYMMSFFRNVCFRTCWFFGTFPWDLPLLFQKSWLMIVPHPMEIMLKKHLTCKKHDTIYLETGTQMTVVLIGKGLVLKGWPSKIEVIGALGIYIYIHIIDLSWESACFAGFNPMLVDINMEVVHSLSTKHPAMDPRCPTS